jgi:hypothetical protein
LHTCERQREEKRFILAKVLLTARADAASGLPLRIRGILVAVFASRDVM